MSSPIYYTGIDCSSLFNPANKFIDRYSQILNKLGPYEKTLFPFTAFQEVMTGSEKEVTNRLTLLGEAIDINPEKFRISMPLWDIFERELKKSIFAQPILSSSRQKNILKILKTPLIKNKRDYLPFNPNNALKNTFLSLDQKVLADGQLKFEQADISKTRKEYEGPNLTNVWLTGLPTLVPETKVKSIISDRCRYPSLYAWAALQNLYVIGTMLTQEFKEKNYQEEHKKQN